MKWKDARYELPQRDIPVLLISSAGDSSATVASYSKARHRFERSSQFYCGGINPVEFWMELPKPPGLSDEMSFKKDKKNDW